MLHEAALDYWNQQRANGLAFCRISMLGFLRLSTAAGVLSRTLKNCDAWAIYQRYQAEAKVKFLAEPINLEQYLAALTVTLEIPNRLWTDADLAAFALAINARLVSFDSEFQRIAGLDLFHPTRQMP
jgi:toxin-antitoxin system PIN domain toxin